MVRVRKRCAQRVTSSFESSLGHGFLVHSLLFIQLVGIRPRYLGFKVGGKQPGSRRFRIWNFIHNEDMFYTRSKQIVLVWFEPGSCVGIALFLFNSLRVQMNQPHWPSRYRNMSPLADGPRPLFLEYSLVKVNEKVPRSRRITTQQVHRAAFLKHRLKFERCIVNK
jgi:hypothetical protein